MKRVALCTRKPIFSDTMGLFLNNIIKGGSRVTLPNTCLHLVDQYIVYKLLAVTTCRSYKEGWTRPWENQAPTCRRWTGGASSSTSPLEPDFAGWRTRYVKSRILLTQQLHTLKIFHMDKKLDEICSAVTRRQWKAV